LAVVVASIWAIGCGGASNEGLAAPATYEEMNFEQRFLFMSDVVLPKMRETFVAFDAKYATMTCSTCHAEGVSKGTYAMPAAGIPLLPASEEEFFEYVKDPEHARWSQFMMDKVWPEMTALLQVKMFDPTTGAEGFSCSNCHKVH
jgi:hypothetical protein